MARIKNALLNGRVILLIVCLLLAVFALYPNPWNQGVSIKGIAQNSSAELAGMVPPKANLAPMARERIIAVNNKPVESVEEYHALTDTVLPNQTVQVKTNKGLYTLLTKPITETITLNQSRNVTKNVTITVNETINGSLTPVKKTIQKTTQEPITQENVIGVQSLGLSVAEAPTSNLRMGLDLQGGTRVLLRPAENVSEETVDLIIESLKERLNIYGLSDVVVRKVSDRPDFIGGGTTFILVEIAGVTEEEVRDLIASQGKFEAKIGNQTVFQGDKDITYVCRTARCSGLDPQRPCGSVQGGWACGTAFQITLSPEAAQRQANITQQIPVIGGSLAEQLVLYLDDAEAARLSIDVGLKGRAVTDISITGGGQGLTQQAAMDDALQQMKRMQTVLISGSLPVELDIVRVDNISPKLGKEFLSNAAFVGLLSVLAVSLILMFVYRKWVIAVPILVTALSEVFLTLGLASLIGWSIDLAAVAGIILAVGTGVDDQIVITDEALSKKSERAYNWKERIKRAFFIIMSAYFTVMVAMTPLLFAGAGLLKGFAITTMLAVTVGVFVTRPAFAALVQKLLE